MSSLLQKFAQNLSHPQPFPQQQLTTLITHLAVAPTDHLDLFHYGLMPMVSLFPHQYVIKNIEAPLPLLRGKQVRWPLSWSGNQTVSAIFIKLGTGGRINHCQLTLTIFENQHPVATTTLPGPTVQDGQWAKFILEPPLSPTKKYLAQLHSPDADNATNTLFLWLTVEYTEEITFLTGNLMDLYHYGLVPITAPPLNRMMELPFPILRGTILQWYVELTAAVTSKVFLKLSTGGKSNRCQLILSIFQEQANQLVRAATSTFDGMTAQDNQWAQFNLSQPLPAGHYVGRLHSPDTDNTANTLFIRLTTLGLDNYAYRTATKPAPLHHLPTISIVVPILTTSPISHHLFLSPYWSACLNSIVTQTYPNWELCIVTDTPQLAWLEEYQQRFPNQIKIVSGAPASWLNLALNTVTGDYLAVLHPEDLLGHEALFEVAQCLNHSPQLDLLYSDEDKVNQGGLLSDPYFKPDWSPELLKGQFYIGQLSIYRTQWLKKIGGANEEFYLESNDPKIWLWRKVGNFREEPYHKQIWDLVLRLTQQTPHIQHLPKILYHQRCQSPLFVPPLSCDLVQAALDRENQGGQVTRNKQVCLLHYPVQHSPLVSIVIPTKDQAALLANCLASIVSVTTYPNWEIIIVDNGSQAPETSALLEQYQTRFPKRFQVIHYPIAFNFSTLVNRGVSAACGEIIFLLNNDTKLVTPPYWLQAMLGFAQHAEIACVGCKLLYPQDQTIQHAGIICGIAGIANHGHKHFPAHSSGYFNRLAVVANYSAVTGAGLMVKRPLWDKVGGFDENLAIAFNDVDFCLKLQQMGKRHVVLPQVIFYHYESQSRGLENTPAKKQRLAREAKYLKQCWAKQIQNDPFYNPHLTKLSEDFSLDPQSIYCWAPPQKSWFSRFGQKLTAAVANAKRKASGEDQ